MRRAFRCPLAPEWGRGDTQRKKWRDVSQGRDVESGREAIFPWEAKVYMLVNSYRISGQDPRSFRHQQ